MKSSGGGRPRTVRVVTGASGRIGGVLARALADRCRGPADGPHQGPYDRSKAAGEVEIRRGTDRGLDAVILNPTSVIGPCDGGPSPMGQVFLDLYRRQFPR